MMSNMAMMTMTMAVLLCLVGEAVSATNAVLPEPYQTRFDYKRSLKKPFLFGDKIPHFEVFGDVIQSPDYIRLTPSVQSMKGALWTTSSIPYTNWQIVLSFSASGRGRLGGDGIALWYTSERLGLGEAMGSSEKWDGLGIFFDTYDNDNSRNNPQIYGILNDGSQTFNPDSDGSEILFSSCTKSFRNSHVPTRVRVTYHKSSLKVEIDTHAKGKDFQLCFQQNDIELPPNYFLGISAATGGLADDHDLISLEFYELDPPRKEHHPNPSQIPVPEDNVKHLEKIQEKVQEMRAKQEIGSEDFAGFLGKISNMDELLSELSLISTTQQDIVQLLESFGVVLNNLAVSLQTPPPIQPVATGSNFDADSVKHIVQKLQDLQHDLGGKLSQIGGATREGSGPSAAIASSITKIESEIQQVHVRLTRMEQNMGPGGPIIQHIRDEFSRLKLESNSRPRRDPQDEPQDNNIWIWVGVGLGGLALAGLIAFFATRKSDSKKFV